jgi:type 1 glutamine amidotransferase
VDDKASPVTRNLPATFVSPTNEWYRWKPSPRADSHIHVLLTLDPANYPLGIKGLLTYGDIPVVWTNTQYKMLYMNMGHGDKIFTSPVQNTLIENGTKWLLGKGPQNLTSSGKVE